MAKKAEPMIFLYDSTIPDFKPPRKGYINFSQIGSKAKTEVIEYLGFDSLSIATADYLVQGGASRYLVDVIRDTSEAKIATMEGGDIAPFREIFFEGGIEIYQVGDIPGTKLEGSYLLEAGKIKFARKPLKVRGKGDLIQHVFGQGKVSVNQARKLIEQIVRGYQFQRDSEQERADRAASDSYSQGRGDATGAAHGTF